MLHPTQVLEPPANPARFIIGERKDAVSGLHYLNARYYDPKLRMLIQPDWFEVAEPGVGTSRYAYSFNDPVNLSDPIGNYAVGLEQEGEGVEAPAVATPSRGAETNEDVR